MSKFYHQILRVLVQSLILRNFYQLKRTDNSNIRWNFRKAKQFKALEYLGQPWIRFLIQNIFYATITLLSTAQKVKFNQLKIYLQNNESWFLSIHASKIFHWAVWGTVSDLGCFALGKSVTEVLLVMSLRDPE